MQLQDAMNKQGKKEREGERHPPADIKKREREIRKENKDKYQKRVREQSNNKHGKSERERTQTRKLSQGL